jgi:iron complex outermembrane receptor protein
LVPHLVTPIYFDNLSRGETYGFEAATNIDINRLWKLKASYSFLRVHLHADLASQDLTPDLAEGDSPRDQVQLHSYFKLARNLELDTAAYYVSPLAGLKVPGYTRIDARLGWRVSEGIEVSGGLQNLLDKQHPEFSGRDAIVASQVRRSVYGKMIFRF